MTDLAVEPGRTPSPPTPRLIALRALCTGLALVATVFVLPLPRRLGHAEPGALVAAVTLGLGLALTGVVERRGVLAGWDPRRIADAVVALSTVLVFVALNQGTYAEGALAGGPEAGLQALVDAWQRRPEAFVLGAFAGAFLWGIPCGLVVLERLDPASARRLQVHAAGLAVFTCGGVLAALLSLWLGDLIAQRVDRRLASR